MAWSKKKKLFSPQRLGPFILCRARNAVACTVCIHAFMYVCLSVINDSRCAYTHFHRAASAEGSVSLLLKNSGGSHVTWSKTAKRHDCLFLSFSLDLGLNEALPSHPSFSLHTSLLLSLPGLAPSLCFIPFHKSSTPLPPRTQAALARRAPCLESLSAVSGLPSKLLSETH